MTSSKVLLKIVNPRRLKLESHESNKKYENDKDFVYNKMDGTIRTRGIPEGTEIAVCYKTQGVRCIKTRKHDCIVENGRLYDVDPDNTFYK